ncbi:hypothetical protein AMTRI_Chr05g72680 [Amborella trichopoda]
MHLESLFLMHSKCYKKTVQKESHAIFEKNIECFVPKDESISCSCKLFEFSGILCQHEIQTLVRANIFQIPDCYLPMRWPQESSLPPRSNASNLIAFNEWLKNLSTMWSTLL